MQALLNRDSLMFFRKIVSAFIVLTFLTSLIVAPAGAQVLPIINAPQSATNAFAPPILLGLKIHPENPLLFDFIVDQGQSKLSTDELKEETTKLVKYFLAALTIPDKEVWVNLSPTEKDRIIPDVLGQTTMGKTMLEQDYVLKQLAASLTNPETDLGKKYWDQVNGARTLDVRRSTLEKKTSEFNKVWIMPAKAEVLESNGIVLVGEKRLKVMLAEEYESNANQQKLSPPLVGGVRGGDDSASAISPLPSPPHGGGGNKEGQTLSSQIFRSTILPTIEKAVNESKDFADVRQIYNSVILAAWYKKALKESLLGKIYADKGKVAGVETDDKAMKQRIYEQYLAAFKKGAYNLIKEEADENGELIPRKYFSGGEDFLNVADIVSSSAISREQTGEVMEKVSSSAAVTVQLTEPATAEPSTLAAKTQEDDNRPSDQLVGVSSSAVQVFRQLAVALGFSLATLFPTVYSLPADAQSLQFSEYYLRHQADFDKSVPRVGNIAQAQEELRKNFNQMIAASKKKHGGSLVPDSVEAPRLKQISGDVQTFDGLVDVSKKELARLASDNNSKAQFQKELLKWWYSFLDENTEYDLQGVRMNNKELDDLRNLVVGKGVGSKKRTGVCQGYAILTTQVFNEVGYQVSSIEVKVNSKGENMKLSGGHMSNLAHLANGENWLFDMAQRGVNLPHQVVVDKGGKEYSVKPGDPLLSKINGWSAEDIRQSQDKAILLSKGLELLKKVQDENSRAIKLSKDGKATQSQSVWAQIVVDIDAFLKENTGALQKINSLDPLFQKSISIDGKNAGGELLMRVLNEQKSLVQSNLTNAQQTSAGGKNVVTFSGDAADMNYINGLVNRLNEASKLVGKNRDSDAQRALTEIVNELSGSKVKELEARAKAQGPQGKGILEVLENMRKTAAGNLDAAQKNLTIAQNNKVIQQENAIIPQFNIIGEDYNKLVLEAKKNPNMPVGKFIDIKGRLDQMSKDYPQMSDRLKGEVQKLRSLVESVINSRSSRGAQNDFSIPVLALENLEPQILAGQAFEWQNQSSAASSVVNDGIKINLNPRIETITGPENIIFAISNGDIIAEAVNLTKKISGTRVSELKRYETTQGAVNPDNEIVTARNLIVKEILYADGKPAKIRFYDERDARQAMTVAIDKIVSLATSVVSSTVTDLQNGINNIREVRSRGALAVLTAEDESYTGYSQYLVRWGVGEDRIRNFQSFIFQISGDVISDQDIDQRFMAMYDQYADIYTGLALYGRKSISEIQKLQNKTFDIAINSLTDQELNEFLGQNLPNDSKETLGILARSNVDSGSTKLLDKFLAFALEKAQLREKDSSQEQTGDILSPEVTRENIQQKAYLAADDLFVQLQSRIDFSGVNSSDAKTVLRNVVYEMALQVWSGEKTIDDAIRATLDSVTIRGIKPNEKVTDEQMRDILARLDLSNGTPGKTITPLLQEALKPFAASSGIMNMDGNESVAGISYKTIFPSDIFNSSKEAIMDFGGQGVNFIFEDKHIGQAITMYLIHRQFMGFQTPNFLESVLPADEIIRMKDFIAAIPNSFVQNGQFTRAMKVIGNFQQLQEGQLAGDFQLDPRVIAAIGRALTDLRSSDIYQNAGIKAPFASFLDPKLQSLLRNRNAKIPSSENPTVFSHSLRAAMARLRGSDTLDTPSINVKGLKAVAYTFLSVPLTKEELDNPLVKEAAVYLAGKDQVVIGHVYKALDIDNVHNSDGTVNFIKLNQRTLLHKFLRQEGFFAVGNDIMVRFSQENQDNQSLLVFGGKIGNAQEFIKKARAMKVTHLAIPLSQDEQKRVNSFLEDKNLSDEYLLGEGKFDSIYGPVIVAARNDGSIKVISVEQGDTQRASNKLLEIKNAQTDSRLLILQPKVDLFLGSINQEAFVKPIVASAPIENAPIENEFDKADLITLQNLLSVLAVAGSLFFSSGQNFQDVQELISPDLGEYAPRILKELNDSKSDLQSAFDAINRDILRAAIKKIVTEDYLRGIIERKSQGSAKASDSNGNAQVKYQIQNWEDLPDFIKKMFFNELVIPDEISEWVQVQFEELLAQHLQEINFTQKSFSGLRSKQMVIEIRDEDGNPKYIPVYFIDGNSKVMNRRIKDDDLMAALAAELSSDKPRTMRDYRGFREKAFNGNRVYFIGLLRQNENHEITDEVVAVLIVGLGTAAQTHIHGNDLTRPFESALKEAFEKFSRVVIGPDGRIGPRLVLDPQKSGTYVPATVIVEGRPTDPSRLVEDKIKPFRLAASSTVADLNEEIARKHLVPINGKINIVSGYINDRYQYSAQLYKDSSEQTFTVLRLFVQENTLIRFAIWEGNLLSNSPENLFKKLNETELASASSALDQERAKLVGQTLRSPEAIIDAFTLKGEEREKGALFREGDTVQIYYKFFVDGKADEKEVTGKITEINRPNDRNNSVTGENTIVRFADFGTKLGNINSIKLVSLAASSAGDVQDVEADKRMFWVDKFWTALHSRKRNINGMYDLGKDNLVKIAKIGDLRWVGIYDQTDNRWFELVVDSNDKPLAYGASMIPVQAYTDSIFLTFNVFSDVQRNRLALGKNKINSWDILQGRMDILRTITGRKSFIVQGKQIFGREAIERTAVIFYLKHGFRFIKPINILVDDLIDKVTKKGEHLEDYQINALAHSGPMSYELPAVSSTPVNSSSVPTLEGDFTKGGIDFDPTNMNLQIKRDGKGVPLPLPEQNLEQINIQGLFPVIINITPINSQTLPIFLGQAPKEPAREPELAARTAS